jgi:hypothetical protein
VLFRIFLSVTPKYKSMKLKVWPRCGHPSFRFINKQNKELRTPHPVFGGNLRKVPVCGKICEPIKKR